MKKKERKKVKCVLLMPFFLAHLYERWMIYLAKDLTTKMKPVVHLLSFESEAQDFLLVIYNHIPLLLYNMCQVLLVL